jgi:putative transposase
MVSLPERRRCVTYLKTEYASSERRACQAMQMNRSSYRYVGGQDLMDDAYQRVLSLSDQYRY